jgi:hypothetical protein
VRPRDGWLRRRIRSAGPERGATLVYALLFITTVSVIVTAAVSLAGAHVHTTVMQRDQTAVAGAADGAAQIAINTLRRGTFTGGSNNCFSGANSLRANNLFAVPSTGAQGSAVVVCDWVQQLEDQECGGCLRRTWVYMDVYVCTTLATNCTSTAGRLALRFKIAVVDPSGSYVAGQRRIEIFAWSVQR